MKDILASIVQGSAIGPASYVVTASDLYPVSAGNVMVKYADDTYLIIPASNISSCEAEIQHIESWASVNNLALNRAKSAEMIVVAPRSRRSVESPPAAVAGFARVDFIKALGVTFDNKLSFTRHIDEVLAGCSQMLFALRTLRSHGLSDSAIHVVYQATIISKLSYASPSWWGYTTAVDRERIEAFIKRSVRQGYRSAASQTFADICSAADNRLFAKVTNNSSHLLHCLLPPKRTQHYSLRTRPHNYQLPTKTSINNSNFIIRLIYKYNCYH